jgi:ribosomal protein L44E
LTNILLLTFNLFRTTGKRRYDRKQSGYGGQTKPVFHKKVSFVSRRARGELSPPCPISCRVQDSALKREKREDRVNAVSQY